MKQSLICHLFSGRHSSPSTHCPGSRATVLQTGPRRPTRSSFTRSPPAHPDPTPLAAMSTASGDCADVGGDGAFSSAAAPAGRRIPPASSMPWVRNLRRFVGSGAGLGSEALMGQCHFSPSGTLLGSVQVLRFIFEVVVGLGFTRIYSLKCMW
jgi:hypothetical protein